MPDLMISQRTNETDEDFYQRQMEAIREFVEEHLWFKDRGARQKIHLIPEQVRLLTDLFYGYIQKAIVWKNRGGGGSLCAAILIWLTMVYQHKSWSDMAGSGEQAQNVYEYTKEFWECFEEAAGLLEGEPLITRTKMKDGTRLKCVATSETQARGKHPPCLCGDESCQKDSRKDDILKAAMQAVFTHSDFVILFTSTFHHPVGFFQETWDSAIEKGFERYRWNVYQTMQRCTVDISCKDCPLTYREAVFDEDGEVVNYQWAGCNGIARESRGFLSRASVLEAKKTNDEETFQVEWECRRPKVRGPVYNPDSVDRAYSHGATFEIPPYRWTHEEKEFRRKQAVGLDWGVETTAIIGPVIRRKHPDHAWDDVVVLREKYFSNERVEAIIGYLIELREEFGALRILPDSSHGFENMEIEAAGFSVEEVFFNIAKDWGIKNLRKWFDKRKILIANEMIELRRCLKAYRKDEKGKPIKKDDHGPDALMCSMLEFLYQEEFGLIETDEDEDDIRITVY